MVFLSESLAMPERTSFTCSSVICPRLGKEEYYKQELRLAEHGSCITSCYNGNLKQCFRSRSGYFEKL